MKLSKLMYDGKVIGYRFFVDEFALATYNPQLYQQYGGTDTSNIEKVEVFGGKVAFVNQGLQSYKDVILNDVGLINAIWMYKNHMHFKRGTQYKYKSVDSLYNDIPNGSEVQVLDYNFNTAKVSVKVVKTGLVKMISMNELV